MIFERWRPVRGFLGLYLVSDKGRVKSQTTGKILKPNEIKGGYLQVHLRNKGKDVMKLVHRLVMEAFKYDCPLGFEVDHLDFDPKNNSVENLRYISIKENRGRKSDDWQKHHNDTLKKMHSDPNWKNNLIEGIARRTNDETWRDKHYKNLEAMHRSDEWLKNVTEANKKRAEDPDWIIKTTEANRKRSKPVIQYDYQNNIVAEYPSAMEAYRQTGIPHQNITKCCLGQRKSAGGSIFKYKEVA